MQLSYNLTNLNLITADSFFISPGSIARVTLPTTRPTLKFTSRSQEADPSRCPTLVYDLYQEAGPSPCPNSPIDVWKDWYKRLQTEEELLNTGDVPSNEYELDELYFKVRTAMTHAEHTIFNAIKS